MYFVDVVIEYWNIVYEFFEAFTEFSMEARVIL